MAWLGLGRTGVVGGERGQGPGQIWHGFCMFRPGLGAWPMGSMAHGAPGLSGPYLIHGT